MDIKDCFMGIILLLIIVVCCLIFLKTNDSNKKKESFGTNVKDHDIMNLIDSVNSLISKVQLDQRTCEQGSLSSCRLEFL